MSFLIDLKNILKSQSSQIGAGTYVITTCGLAHYETINKHKATASRQAFKCQEICSEASGDRLFGNMLNM